MTVLRRCLLFFGCAGIAYGLFRFCSVNSETVNINLLVASVESISLWKVTVVALLAGAAISLILVLFPLTRQVFLVLRLRKKIDALEEELNGLRALPLSKNEDPAWNSDEGTLQLADDSPRND
ncbi:LapA family protein [Myxococcota bacterium]|nr:LapA family protein [Myxococcota bacterium]